MNDTLPGGGGYVVAAYLAFLIMLLVYIGIMALRISRLERELIEMHKVVDRQRDEARRAEPTATQDEPAEVR